MSKNTISRFGKTIVSTSGLLIILGVVLAAVVFPIWTAEASDSAKSPQTDATMPVLTGEKAIEELKENGSYDSLADAIAAKGIDNQTNRPEAITKLTASDGGAGFGFSVAVSGNTAIVGASNGQGSAYVFVRDDTTWTEQQKLTASDGAADDLFGFSVAISGDTVVVGAPKADGTVSDQGAAYIFVRSGTTWNQQQKLISEGPGRRERFGRSVAVDGDTLIVGASDWFAFGGSSPYTGAAYVFVRNGASWTQQQQILADDGEAVDYFGTSVAISGDTAIIGSAGDDFPGDNQDQGSAYISVRAGSTWAKQQKLSASDGRFFDYFGQSVAISGNLAIIGARQEGVSRAGSAYIFERSGTVWTMQQKLIADDGAQGDYFGMSVAILGDTAVVGAPQDDIGANANKGSAYIFLHCETTWVQVKKVFASDGAGGGQFGISSAISGRTLLFGAWAGGSAGQGSAHIYDGDDVPHCDVEIEVNVTTDESDADLTDDVCDVDIGQTGEQCSLRAAIETANTKEGADDITFNIPGGGVQVITPASDLPAITGTVTIDATTQPGYTDRPVVQLNGGTSGVTTGLIFFAGSNGSSLKGMSINRFGRAGLQIVADSVIVGTSHIGIDADGLTIPPEGSRQLTGIDITGKNNTIGGQREATNAGSNSLITGNVGAGVKIHGGNATGNRVIGIDFGFTRDPNGTPSNQNTLTQVEITDGASDNTIGSLTEIERNIIANANEGIAIEDAAHDNLVIGNAIAQTHNGVFIGGAHDNTIGGERDSGARNYFVDNDFGIVIGFATSSARPDGAKRSTGASRKLDELRQAPQVNIPSVGNKIYGNVIGVNPVGDPFLGPNDYGIVVAWAENTQIGSGVISESNFVGFSSLDGLVITKDASGTQVKGNFIGTDRNGSTIGANRQGVVIHGSGSLISGNVISGNNDDGVRVISEFENDPAPTLNTISNNSIGTNATGARVPNGSAGIHLQGNNNTVNDNTISGNVEDGVIIQGDDNKLLNNKIGTNSDGTAAISNDKNGAVILGSRNRIAGNTISGNVLGGLSIAPFDGNAAAPNLNIVVGNKIGTTSDGTGRIYNGRAGITVVSATNTLIGGFGADIPADRNIVSGNETHGIALDAGTTNTRISGNYIGTAADGMTALGNIQNGIFLQQGVGNTMIGGPEENAGNTIAYNGKNGILLAADAGNNNIIDPNRIFGNALHGIDIGEDGHTPNDPTDADVGPNKLQNYPVITSAEINGSGDLIVSYNVDSAPEHSNYGSLGIYVEFFEADATGAGMHFLSNDHYPLSDYTGGLPGDRQKNLGNAAALGFTLGESLTATATDADGNSSEFTPAFPTEGIKIQITGTVTSEDGRGIRGASVVLFNAAGDRKIALTNSFGTYRIDDVPVGVTYNIRPFAKRYQFAGQIIQPNGNLTGIDFVGLN